MAVRPLVRLGDPILRERAREVALETLRTREFQELVDDMIDTMHESSGAGLAAPQIGVSLRVAVAQVDKNPRYPTMGSIPLCVWINPIVTVLSTDLCVVMYEGCLSVPGLRGRVTRPAHIRLDALDRRGAPQSSNMSWTTSTASCSSTAPKRRRSLILKNMSASYL
jgi:peptide deformylase